MPPILNDVTLNVPQCSLQTLDRVGALAILKEETFYDYRDHIPLDMFDDTLRRLQKHSYEDLIRAKEARDGPLMLKLGLRLRLFFVGRLG